ncbi:ABC transporter substrate-binding protein [Thioalkalivibrio denitrificans]|uniref:ABC transporter substrate-binding protein n=1 Tax=Thioalkalivibrio denitrificans TaxID=108003 RepID=A0A1V3NJD6_9GAMM|nr:transporter substrate-binding domain-containing protein [Thioalkalivibrio denitrificans]OOG25227.1 ABC transporter substrate-binding protein [Thioalkalivibrio denitrificans]
MTRALFRSRAIHHILCGLMLVVVSLAWSNVRATGLNDLQWITEEFAPYNFSQDGVAAGIAVDVLMEMWQRLGVERTAADIQVLPWARGYRITQEQPGTCLFSTTVTDARRELFVFIEPLIDSNVSIIAARERGLQVDNVEDMSGYQIGVVREDIGDQVLQEDGFTGTYVRTDSARILMRMLHGGRFDAVSYNFVTASWTMREEGIDPRLYEPVLTLREGYMGYACHKDTDPELIAQLQETLDALREDGTVEAIIQRYLE